MKFSLNSTLWRWTLAVVWTALCAYLLLWPAEENTVEDVSDAFGGSDLTDAVGHVGLLFGETLVIFNLLRSYMTPRRALRWAIGSALIWGSILELAQNWIPARGFALLDLGANALGVAIFALVALTLSRLSRRVER